MVHFRSPHAGAPGVVRCDVCRVTTHPLTRASYPAALAAMRRAGWDAATIVRHVCPACAAAASRAASAA